MSTGLEIMSNILYKSDQYGEMGTVCQEKSATGRGLSFFFMVDIDTDSYIDSTAVRNCSIFIKNEPHKINGDLSWLNSEI